MPKHPCVKTLILSFVMATAPLSLIAQSTESDIRAKLIGKPLYLRGFWSADKLIFDSDGESETASEIAPFTEAGIDVTSVKLKGNKLQIEGRRMGLEFGPAGAMKRVPMKSKKMTLEIPAGAEGSFDKALDTIFAPNLSSLIPQLPFFWQTYAEHYFAELDSAPNSTPPVQAQPTFTRGGNRVAPESVMHIGGRVTPPTTLWDEQPKFTAAARALRYSGNVKVYLWVSKEGSPSHISIATPAGLGLDEAAVEAVKKYRFAPATLNGKPVTVDLYIDVNFQIF